MVFSHHPVYSSKTAETYVVHLLSTALFVMSVLFIRHASLIIYLFIESVKHLAHSRVHSAQWTFVQTVIKNLSIFAASYVQMLIIQ